MEKIPPVKIVGFGYGTDNYYRVYWSAKPYSYTPIKATDEMAAFVWAMSEEGQASRDNYYVPVEDTDGEDNPG
jgi:hypothetical protein